VTIRHDPLVVRDHRPSRAWVSVGGGGAVVEISGTVVGVVVDEVVVSASVVLVSPEVVGCSGVADDAAPAHAVSASRGAQRPATAERRSTHQYGTR
jgi:hypothetical protein